MEITFLQGAVSGTGLTTYTFTAQNLGAAADDRYIIVCASSRKGGSVATSIASVTVGGITATQVVQATTTSTNSSVAGIYIAAVPTGTTGDVVVNFIVNQTRAGIALYRATDINPIATFTSTSNNNVPISSATVLTNGILVGAGTGSSTTSPSITGLVADFDSSISGGGRIISATAKSLGQQAGRSLSVGFASNENVGVFAAFRPQSQAKFIAFF
ncbi:MAG: hypothetical protein WAQ27_00905 [Candidatus Microsaccharimonas sp.]